MFQLRRDAGSGIVSLPVRNFTVWLCGCLSAVSSFISPAFPLNTTSPPNLPASGPMSMMWSAARRMSSSCSTTTTVLPNDCKSLSTFISLNVSRECSPMLGSSSIYSEPTRLLPSEAVRFILWLSPPLNVLDWRFNVRYPSPTSTRNCNLLRISVIRRLLMAVSCSSSTRLSNQSLRLTTGISTRFVMLLPFIFTYSTSFFNRVP